MNVTRFDNPAAFYERSERFLLADEAANNLLLGITSTLIEHPDRYGDEPPYLAVCEEAGEVRLVAIRTPPHQLLLSPTSADPAVAVLVDDLLRDNQEIPGVNSAPNLCRSFAEVWTGRRNEKYRLGRNMRIFKIEQVVPVGGVPGSIRPAGKRDRPLLIDWMTSFAREIHDIVANVERTVDSALGSDNAGFVLWEHGEPVSIAAYGGPTPHGIRISAVYTPPELRRQGYASALVANLSGELLAGGNRFCFLFTDLANPTANRIYQRIGFEAVCDISEYRFER